MLFVDYTLEDLFNLLVCNSHSLALNISQVIKYNTHDMVSPFWSR